MNRRRRNGNICVDTPVPFGGALDWQEILRDYDESHAHNEERQISWFRDQPSLRAAIEMAAHATDERGKRYDHQYRIRRAAIAAATAALLAAEPSVAAASSFDDLFNLVSVQLRGVDGIGELYCYDTALRIGAYLGKFPTRVHLHRGTRAGAMAIKPGHRGDTLEVTELPPELRSRQPLHVENILCIYKDRLGASTNLPARRRTAC
ncbi:MAG TPA: hypothetical protein VII75_06985 [Thermoanaerobaculia bacterium]